MFKTRYFLNPKRKNFDAFRAKLVHYLKLPFVRMWVSGLDLKTLITPSFMVGNRDLN